MWPDPTPGRARHNRDARVGILGMIGVECERRVSFVGTFVILHGRRASGFA
jgi:hypothetical protein